MFRSLDHPQGATLFLAKFTSKTFIKLLYMNRVLWQHVVLCKIMLLATQPGAFPVRRKCVTSEIRCGLHEILALPRYYAALISSY